MSYGYSVAQNPKWTRKHSYLALLLLILVAVISLNNFQQHTFTLEASSDFELKRALTIKALQVFKVSNDSIVCSDNIREFNITGYRMMSYEALLDRADVVGDVEFFDISKVDLGGNDPSIFVWHTYAFPRNVSSGFQAEGVRYQFHHFFSNLWSWNDYNGWVP
jgi:hypothetical protein